MRIVGRIEQLTLVQSGVGPVAGAHPFRFDQLLAKVMGDRHLGADRCAGTTQQFTKVQHVVQFDIGASRALRSLPRPKPALSDLPGGQHLLSTE